MTLLPQPRESDLGAGRVPVAEPSLRVGVVGLPPQGYEITVSENGEVRVEAADDAGAFYAGATLAQLARAHRGTVPVGRVRDWPDLPIRGVMLDVSRDKVPTMGTLYAWVDRLASWKVNELQLYTEHTFAYRNHEVVWRDASPMTPEEVRALDAYCADRHVELVPNQNCLGHMGRWLAHPEYRPLAMAPDGYETRPGHRRPPGTLEPTNPRSLALVRELLGELLACFSSRRFVHVGLDEPFEMPDERWPDYLEWMRALRALRELDGCEMLVWGDVVDARPERAPTLPSGVTVVDWGYEDWHPFEDRLAVYEEAGIPRWVAPGTSSWLTILGRVANMRGNCARAATAALTHAAPGYLNTDWGDLGHLQYLPVSEPGLAYGAAVSWCAATNRDLDLGRALDLHCFDDETGVLGATLLELGDAYRWITPQFPNVSVLVLHLYFPQLQLGRGFARGASGEEYARVGDRLADALDRLRRAQPARADGSLVLDELRNAVALVRVLCDDARARLATDGTLPAVPGPERARLAEALRPVIDEHRRLWLARNRPGGLKDSLAWPEHLLHCYETGTVEETWGGW